MGRKGPNGAAATITAVELQTNVQKQTIMSFSVEGENLINIRNSLDWQRPGVPHRGLARLRT